MERIKGWLSRERKYIQRSTRLLWFEEDKACLLCGGSEGPICDPCQRKYFPIDLGRCRRCGKLIDLGLEFCEDCRVGKGPQGITQAATWGHYAGLWRDFIRNMKFKARPLLLQSLARPLAEAALRYLPPSDGLVPVPLHSERLAERGFNQAEVISSLLHWELGLPLVYGLERIRLTQHQVGLQRADRLANLKNAFIFQGASILGRDLWLIDDVITTGATVEACAEALVAAGARRVYAFSLAGGREAKRAE